MILQMKPSSLQLKKRNMVKIFIGLNKLNNTAKITDCVDALPCEITHFRSYEIDDINKVIECKEILENEGLDVCVDGFDIFIDYKEVK